MDGDNENAGNVGHERERGASTNRMHVREVDEVERKIRECFRRESSEGAEESLKARQSRKHLVPDREDDYNRELPGEKVSRWHIVSQVGYESVTPRRHRSRNKSVRDYRGAASSSKRVSSSRSSSRDLEIRRRRELRGDSGRNRSLRSPSYELGTRKSYWRERENTERNRRVDSEERRIRNSSIDEDYYITPRRKRTCSRSPYARFTKGSYRDELNKQVSDNDKHNIVTKFLDILKQMRGQSSSKLSLNNVLPEFDPMSKDQTILTWLTKVEECAEIYGWDDKETIHFALPKLTGVAKTWYNGLSTVLYSWTAWKNKLIESFPCRDDYADLLTSMLAKKAQYGDSLEHYYYAKINLLNRCDIRGRKAVDCVLNGIEDRAVRVGAQAAQFREPEELLKYLKTVNVEVDRETVDKSDNKKLDRRLTGDPVRKRSEPSKRIICYNCNEEAHKNVQCKQPPATCSTCGKLGHLTTFCRFNRNIVNVKNDKSLNESQGNV